MKTKRLYLCSVSSSDDDVPLVVKKIRIDTDSSDDDDEPLAMKKHKKLDKDGLYSYGLYRCEFCDAVFYNKFEILVHNSQHIIIPLIRREIHLCLFCFQHFSSQNELNNHKTTEHNILTDPNLLEAIVRIQPVIKCVDNLKEIIKKKNEIMNIVKEEPFDKHDTRTTEMQATLENIVNAQAVVKCDNSVTELINSSKSLRNGENILFPATVEASGIQRGNSNIRSRIIFEDDIEDDDIEQSNSNILNDLTNDCKVDLENGGLFNALGKDLSKKGQVAPFSGKIFLGSKIAKSDATVPYNDLLIPGNYACRRCFSTFLNRYQSVIHETTHMKIKHRRPPLCCICDRYIAGNYKSLRRHISKRHPHSLDDIKDVTPCIKCGLKYHNYEKHANNYHTVYKCPCGERFFNNKQLEKHERTCVKAPKENCDGDETRGESPVHILPDSYQESNDKQDKVKTTDNNNLKIFKLCEMCAMFKQSTKFKFICVGELSEIGSRQTCEDCKKEFFHLKVLKRVPRKPEYSKYEYPKIYYDTNETKLKHFQRKLKYLNKMSRY